MLVLLTSLLVPMASALLQRVDAMQLLNVLINLMRWDAQTAQDFDVPQMTFASGTE